MRITLCTRTRRGRKKNGEEATQFSPQLRHFTRQQRRRFLRRQLFLLARLPPTIHAMRRRRRRRRNKSGKFHRCKTIRADRRNGFSPHHTLFSHKKYRCHWHRDPFCSTMLAVMGEAKRPIFRPLCVGEGWLNWWPRPSQDVGGKTPQSLSTG